MAFRGGEGLLGEKEIEGGIVLLDKNGSNMASFYFEKKDNRISLTEWGKGGKSIFDESLFGMNIAQTRMLGNFELHNSLVSTNKGNFVIEFIKFPEKESIGFLILKGNRVLKPKEPNNLVLSIKDAVPKKFSGDITSTEETIRPALEYGFINRINEQGINKITNDFKIKDDDSFYEKHLMKDKDIKEAIKQIEGFIGKGKVRELFEKKLNFLALWYMLIFKGKCPCGKKNNFLKCINDNCSINKEIDEFLGNPKMNNQSMFTVIKNLFTLVNQKELKSDHETVGYMFTSLSAFYEMFKEMIEQGGAKLEKAYFTLTFKIPFKSDLLLCFKLVS